jgi:hypothetical protein
MPVRRAPRWSYPDSADATTPDGRVPYREWGWPVTCHRDQVWLSLEPDAEVSVIFPARRCLPPGPVHPEAPGRRFVLAGERYGVALPWLPGMRRFTGALLVALTVRPRGLVTWMHPPRPDAVQLCWEVDVFAAVQTALRELRSDGLPPGSGLPV